MGFILMIFSMLIGIGLVSIGVFLKGSKHWHKISIAVGTLLILFAVYLGLPK